MHLRGMRKWELLLRSMFDVRFGVEGREAGSALCLQLCHGEHDGRHRTESATASVRAPLRAPCGEHHCLIEGGPGGDKQRGDGGPLDARGRSRQRRPPLPPPPPLAQRRPAYRRPLRRPPLHRRGFVLLAEGPTAVSGPKTWQAPQGRLFPSSPSAPLTASRRRLQSSQAKGMKGWVFGRLEAWALLDGTLEGLVDGVVAAPGSAAVARITVPLALLTVLAMESPKPNCSWHCPPGSSRPSLCT